MKTQFNQSQGSTSRETNKEAIARIFGLKKSQVGYLSTTTPIDSYVILFDKETQTCWYRGTATGTPISWNVNGESLSLTTNSGTSILTKSKPWDELNQKLSSPQGFGAIGKFSSLINLRNHEPTYPGESVILERIASGKPTVNVVLRHDPTDTTSVDDDISIFVTPGGARWKLDISDGYDMRLAGVNVDGTNFSSALNKIVSVIISKIVANGRVNNVARRIKVVPTNFLCQFFLTDPVDLPSIVSCSFYGSPFIESQNMTGLYSFRIANQPFSTLTKAMMQAETSWPNGPLNQVIGNKVINSGDGGRITLRGPGFSDGVPRIGVILGNDVTTDKDVRDCSVEDMNIFGFDASHTLGGYFTFMAGFRNCNFSRCNVGMRLPNITGNAGERMWYDSCTFGNMTSHALHVFGAGTYSLVNTSIDFIGGDMFHYGSDSSVSIEFISGHIEGIQGYDAAKDTPTNYSQARVHIHSAVLRDPRQGSGQYRGIRQRWSCPSSSFGQGLSVIDESISPGMENTKPNTAYPCFMGSPSNTGVYIETPRTANRGTPWLNSYSDSCSKRINPTYFFITSAGTGELGQSQLVLDYNFSYTKTGDGIVEYGVVGDADADGFIPFKITCNDVNTVINLFCNNRSKATNGNKPLWGACSVKLANSVGDVMIAPLRATYLGSTITSIYNDTTKTVTSTLNPVLRSTNVGVALNLRDLLNGSGLTTNDYQATYPRYVTGYYQGNDFFVPGFRLWNFTGTIYLKLPIWWFEGDNFGA
ncbi:tail spike protein [Escherichia phage vB_EcoM_KWBSE43-6]|uniref:Tail spike TSP1/Gp66 N-terminal domain-containing protein n=1 Tax=Escherichia phage vB_EcoM_KWBSE43-6 TaxID=2508194 RepID=A0A482MZW9_9CAUD|nr:tail spike protein [Escherichia phage vB_EcoM_KWBSE43-6]QBQ78975.1 hypothetical protein KWBSE43_00155 [Escherichia phage vB_EcoM_KWBSE43-6]